MKKLTLLLAAALMITGGAFAQDKACCKKGAKCTKSCCKKDGSKEEASKEGTAKDAKTTASQTKTQQNKPKA